MKDPSSLSCRPDAQALEARFALRIAARLNEQAARQPHAIEERLRFARQQALARARAQRKAVAAPGLQVLGGGTLALGGGKRAGDGRWWRAAAVLPLAVLLGGLALIQWNQAYVQIETAAQIDVELLADDLPPAAYSDPGFSEFLKHQQNP